MAASGAEMPATSAANDSISSTRRRQALLENSVRDPVSNGVIPVSDRSAKVVATSAKELSRGSKGNSVAGKSKDFLVIKKGAVSSTASPRRRKSTLKPEKSKWETILNVLIKNLVLLAVLFWIGQTIWRWADKSEHGAGGTPFAALEFEGRISEVETSLKKMTKMTQVQLEVMDERSRQLADKNAFMEKELSTIAARTDNLDKSISKLSVANFLSKKELETTLSELKESSTRGDGNGLSLDDVATYAKELILKEIEKHAADGLGRADYALASGGGKVVKHSEPYTSGKFTKWLPMAKGRNDVHSNAHKLLEPSFGEPGQCFPLKGSTGFVEIRLRTGIVPDAITLEHVSKSVAYDRSSAPKDCSIYGWFEAPEDDSSSNAEKMILLKQLTYDLERSNAQTFDIETPVPGVINTIRLDFSSNHGSPSHTCIYRLRVHGHEP